MKKTILLAVLILLLGAGPLYAWDSFGHMEVAYLAYQKLTPAMQARVWTLLQMNPDFHTWEGTIPAGTSNADKQVMIFMIAATWADEIKYISPYKDRFSDEPGNPDTPDGATSSQNIGYTDLYRHRYWHFVDRPFSQDHTALPPIPQPNAQTQIAAFRAVLASTSLDDLKSYDLVWLLHLVGDVHQPLHCSTRVSSSKPAGDNGGNGVTVHPGNKLHTYWDDVVGTTPEMPDYQSVIAAAKQLPAPQASLASEKNEDVWITESFNYTTSKVYKSPVKAKPDGGPFTLTTSYQTKAATLAKQRVALAGARLANLLNQELK
jgi:hypothetical protein